MTTRAPRTFLCMFRTRLGALLCCSLEVRCTLVGLRWPKRGMPPKAGYPTMLLISKYVRENERDTEHEARVEIKGFSRHGEVGARKKTIGKSYDVYEKDRLKNGQIGNTYDLHENTGGYASYPTMFMKNKVVRKDCSLRCTSATRAASGTYASLNFCIARRCRGNSGVIGNPLKSPSLPPRCEPRLQVLAGRSRGKMGSRLRGNDSGWKPALTPRDTATARCVIDRRLLGRYCGPR